MKRILRRKSLRQSLGYLVNLYHVGRNGICYPDIELLPDIAEFFGVTVDCLMGINETVRKERIAKYLEQFQEAVSQGRIDDCIAVARNGIAEYPNSYMLLNKLMYALFLAGDSDGNIPEWQENMKKYDSEITNDRRADYEVLPLIRISGWKRRQGLRLTIVKWDVEQ